MQHSHVLALIVTMNSICVAYLAAPSRAQDSVPAKPDIATFEARAAGFKKMFNEGKAKELAAQFLPDGELIDDQGNLYQGRQELQDLFERFFATYPGAKLTMAVDSVRTIGSRLAIEEGTRIVTAERGPVTARGESSDSATTVTVAAATGSSGEGSEKSAIYTKPVEAQLRYVCVWSKVGDDWKVASVREFANDPPPTPYDMLQPLEWLVGDWVSEGGDSAVRISYRWSDDGNYLLGDYEVTAGGKTTMDSVQRIGWDPLRQQIRSWLFDSDGGYGEGQWTTLENGYMIRSSAVTPDGGIGSANIEAKKLSDSRFVLKGTDRIVGDAPVEDFEITVTKQPPRPQQSR
jgi:uncharacterized protein (TIGR02246 family)